MAELRDAGEITSGPPPMTARNRSQFLQQLDEVIQSLTRPASRRNSSAESCRIRVPAQPATSTPTASTATICLTYPVYPVYRC